jgi:signal peptidase
MTTSTLPQAAPAARRPGLVRVAFGWLELALAWLVIAVVVVIAGVCLVIPRVAGATPYTILTGSMRPHLPPGTLVVVRPVDPTQIRLGTVITYQLNTGDPTVVTHRVVTIEHSASGRLLFQTQGDANPEPDPTLVRPVQVRGELWYAEPYLGYVNSALNKTQHRSVVLIGSVLLFGYAGVMFAGSLRDRLRRRALS